MIYLNWKHKWSNENTDEEIDQDTENVLLDIRKYYFDNQNNLISRYDR